MTKHDNHDGDDKHMSHKHKEHKHDKKCDKESLNDVLFDLIESVANEENALALLIKAEADKIQAFIGKNCDFPTKPRNKEILDLNRSVTQMLETIVMKEWLLLKKLERTLEVIRKPREDCENK